MPSFGLDHDSKIPLYHQLKEQLKRGILQGEFREGDLFPSERKLRDLYDISNTTIRCALNDLVHENYLTRKPGKGTFVRNAKKDFRKDLGFTRNMEDMGIVPSTRVMSRQAVKADKFVQERLGLTSERKVLKVIRLRLADELPMMLERRFIRTDLCPGIQGTDLSRLLWDVYINDYGRKPCRHSQNLKITKISGYSARLLGVNDDSPAFLIESVTYLEDGQAIDCESSFYRSDKYDLAFQATVA